MSGAGGLKTQGDVKIGLGDAHFAKAREDHFVADTVADAKEGILADIQLGEIGCARERPVRCCWKS